MPNSSEISSRAIHVDAWSKGFRFTFDGTLANLRDIASMAGVRPDDLIATRLPEPVTFRMTKEGLEASDVDFEHARRGCQPVGLDDIAHLVDDEFEPLLRLDTIAVVDRMDDQVPEDVARQFAAYARNGISKGAACCVHMENGNILVVLDIGEPDAVNLRHELVHATQCVASETFFEETLAEAADDGHRIRKLVEQEGYPGRSRECLDWMKSACEVAKKDDIEPEGQFDLARLIYPCSEITDIASTLGLQDKRGIVAALFADALTRTGFDIEPSGNLAREIVAYRQQSGLTEAFRESLLRTFDSTQNPDSKSVKR